MVRRFALTVLLFLLPACDRDANPPLWSFKTHDRRIWEGRCTASNFQFSDNSVFFTGGLLGAVSLWQLDRLSGVVLKRTDPYSWANFVYADKRFIAFTRGDIERGNQLEIFTRDTETFRSQSSTRVYAQPMFLNEHIWLVPVGEDRFEIWNPYDTPPIKRSIPARLGYSAVQVGQAIFVNTVDGWLHGYSLRDGSTLFSQKVAARFVSEIQSVRGVIAAAAQIENNYYLLGYDARTFTEKWRHVLPEILSTHYGVIAADEDHFYLTGNFRLKSAGVRAISPGQGDLVWSFGSAVSANSVVAAADGKVIFASDDMVSIFDGIHGDMLFQTTLSSDVVRMSPAIHGEHAFIATEDCLVRAIQIPQGVNSER